MKRHLSLIAASASLLLGIASCATQEAASQEETAGGALRKVSFISEDTSTKSVFNYTGQTSGSVPVLWTGNEEEFFVNLNLSTANPNTKLTKASDISVSEDGKTATFSVELSDDNSGSYTFYAVSPASAYARYVDSEKGILVEIPANQTSGTASVDESAMPLVGWNDTPLDAFPDEGESVGMQFHHVGAYLKMTLTGLSLEEGDEVASVSLYNADKPLGGKVYYDPSSKAVGDVFSQYNTITITRDDLTPQDGTIEDLWATILPVSEGFSFKVTVTTKSGKEYSVTKTARSDLSAGQIGSFSLSFEGVTATSGNEFVLIKSADEITAGCEIVIAYTDGSTTYAMSQTVNSGNYIELATVTRTDDIITLGEDTEAEVYTVFDGSKTGSFAFQAKSSEKYLNIPSGKNKLNVTGDIGESSSWTVSVTSEGTPIQNVSDTEKYIQYNSSATRFSSYKGTLEHVSIFKRNSSGTSSGDDDDDPTADKGTEANPYTAEEANDLIKSGQNDEDAEVYVTGIVSSIKEVSTQYGNATFYISVDGSSSGQFYIYRTKYIDGAKFTSEDQIQVGDTVVIKGYLVAYTGSSGYTTNEMQNGEIVSIKRGTSSGGDDDDDTSTSGWLELPATSEKVYTHTMTIDSREMRDWSFVWDEDALVAPWVAYPLNADIIGNNGKGNVKRTNNWGYDPLIDKNKQPLLKNGYSGGYTKGHQIPSADRRYSEEQNSRTFYYTNMTPQLSTLNSNAWNTLEDKVRAYSKNCDTLYVITGCVIKNSTTYATDNNGKKVTVPVGYYKAVLAYKNSNSFGHSCYRACAWYFEHSYSGKYKFSTSAISVDELEDKLGMDLFVNLKDKVGEDIYNDIESEDPKTEDWWE